jgi:serine/threonine protein kinase
MTENNWEQLKPLFIEAIALSAADRPAYIAKIDRHNQQLGHQLASLLQRYEQKTFFIDKPIGSVVNLQPHHIPLLSQGEVLLDRFTLVRLLGSGGMGDVYEAQDSQLGRIALKTIRPDLADDPHMRSRFRDEVQLARKVSNYHVCRIHELFMLPIGSNGRNLVFLTMEFLEGITISDRLKTDGPIPWREAETIAQQICQGLTAIHEAGIIHRDLKSRNIMLSTRLDTLRVVVMDFGLAHQTYSASPEITAPTISMSPVGTPEYMAPEQFEAGQLSLATDIYALGVVLYEMVTAKRPFQAPTPVATAIRRAKRPPRPSSIQAGLPRRWDDVIDRCLEYDRERRFQSANEVARALIAWWPRSLRWRYRDFRTVSALFVLALALPIATILWKTSHSYYSPPQTALSWYEKGVEAFQLGTYLGAEELFQSALAIDNNFALAHASLSDAWNELDYRGNAAEQMAAVSSDQESRLRPAQRIYVEVVRSTLNRDFQAAINGYKRLLVPLPMNERSSGYVDLGRTYEKMGDIAAALKAYQEAKRQSPEAPAAFLRAAVLESREGVNSQAATDFDRANQLYTKLGNLEGTAEVAYQQSYWQSTLRNFKEARIYAQKSFDAAKNMPVPSVQIEVRALSRFSAIDHGTGDDERAIGDAERAITLAHENGLEYWETDALLRQGAGHLGKRDFIRAMGCFERALRAAERNHWPRLVALAQVNLATLRDQQNQPQDIQGLAVAMDYYKTYQFPVESFYPMLLLTRGKNALSEYVSALQSGVDVLTVGRQLANPLAVAQAEEAIGTSYFGLQQYPDALNHFTAALDAAKQANDPETTSFQSAHCADVLIRLGRFREADEIIRTVTNSALASEFSRIRIRLLLELGKYHQAIQLAGATLALHSDLDPSVGEDIRIAAAIAALRTGLSDRARSWVAEALSIAQSNHDAEMQANANLTEALINAHANAPMAAKTSAENALQFFDSHQQRESTFFALFYLAKAEKALGNNEAAKQSASRALRILSNFEHDWDPSGFKIYRQKPDVWSAARELAQM